MPRKVTVNTGFTNVGLPNGLAYNAGDAVVLTDEQAAKLLGNVFTKTVVASDGVSRAVLVDNGSYGTTTGNAGARPTVSAVTSSQNATAAATDLTTSEALANALKVSYNAAQVDIAALRAEVLALTNALVTAGIATGGTQS